MSEAIETWKPVVGYEGIYEVSDLGRVRSLDRKNSIGARLRGRMIKLYLCGSKGMFRAISLCKNGVQENKQVAHLVLDAFVGPGVAGAQAKFADGNVANISLSNLSWSEARGARLTDTQANEIRTSSERPVDLAPRYGVSAQQISNIKCGNCWKSAGVTV